MCGIVGIMSYEKGAIVPQHMNIFTNLLWSDAARGMHGTGVFAVADDGSNYRVRAGGPPHKLLESPEFDKFDKFVSQKWVRFVCGHNRYATRGGLDTKSTHPFRSEDGKIILVHNGTLDSHRHLPDGKKFDVDSEAICHAISVQGIEKTINSLRGAWAIVYYNENDKSLNFIRNSERPLFLAWHEKDAIVAWASEEEMLKWVLHRNGMYMFECKSLPENQHLSFKIDSIKPHVKEIKGAADVKKSEGGWKAWEERMHAVGKKDTTVEEDKKVIYLPPPVYKKQTSSATTTGNSGTGDNRGAPFQGQASTRKAAPSTADKGSWQGASSLHDLYLEKELVVWPMTYKAIDTDRGRNQGLFQIHAIAEDYPDIDFYVNVKGENAVLACMEAAGGMKGKIKSILRSMSAVAKHPHQIFLTNPEPLFVAEPENIPDHAVVH